MDAPHRFTREIAGRTLTIEVGRFATQAHGSCAVQYGNTVVLATAVMGEQKEGMDYFPLTVDYEERLYAAGKIKGSRFIKREGRPTDEAILTTRLVDRSIRPRFDLRMRHEVQVITTVLSVDFENDPDVLAIIAASCCLHISKIPWNGPIGAVRIGVVNGECIVNPTQEQTEQSILDCVVAGIKDHIVMIEAGGKEAPESIVSQAIQKSFPILSVIEDLQNEIQKTCGQQKIDWNPKEEIISQSEYDRLEKETSDFTRKEIKKIFGLQSKTERAAILQNLETRLSEYVTQKSEWGEKVAPLAIDMMRETYGLMVRERTFSDGIRVDGRKADDIRSISVDVSVLPRTHGSGLFQRGDTQVLSIVTLGAPGAEQTIDEMEIEGKKRFMHHYNFPPYAVGEIKPMRGPGRREIGHGALAEKALIPVVPPKDQFPYTIRVVSEVLESNGSSSQASICGSTLSLMDAGVPIKAPVAGIAIGLYNHPHDSSHSILLTDIQGIEDHDGDMDFKIAGTRDGVTAIQLDVKSDGISSDLCGQALGKGRQARLKILDHMKDCLEKPRPELSPFAPRIETLMIDPEKIRDVIGVGGKMIHQIIDETGVAIDIEDNGLVMVTSTDQEGMKKALQWIQNIVREVAVGEEYEGVVTQIVRDRNNGGDIGAVVEILPGKDGMIHISELDYRRIERVSDVLKIGDRVRVKVKEIDRDRGRISLSRKALLPRPEGFDNDDQHSQSGRFDRRPGDRRQRPNRRPPFRRRP